MVLLTINGDVYEPLKQGFYCCVFDGIDDSIETSKGKAYRWAFTVTDDDINGECKGRKISVLSDRENPPTIKNKTGRFIASLIGRPVEKGTQVNPDDYIGKLYMVIVDVDGRVSGFSPRNS